MQFIIYSCDSFDLFCCYKCRFADPVIQDRFLFGGSQFKRMYQQECLFIAGDVAPDIFPESGSVSIDVQQIIL